MNTQEYRLCGGGDVYDVCTCEHALCIRRPLGILLCHSLPCPFEAGSVELVFSSWASGQQTPEMHLPQG